MYRVSHVHMRYYMCIIPFYRTVGKPQLEIAEKLSLFQYCNGKKIHFY